MWALVWRRLTVRAVVLIEVAGAGDIGRLVELESSLFAEDAGVHDEFADTTWPSREGADDFRRLLGDEQCVVFVARTADGVAGFLDGYRTASSSTRQPMRCAVLRSIYVADGARRAGIASALVSAFVDWSRSNGCIEVRVDSYADNHGAQLLYQRLGFAPTSVSRILRL
jgi:aminoglycoside 6'-N-acetyltransferase I